jgi:hypothetical protein
MACWRWSRPSVGCERRGLRWAREVGRGGSRRSRAPQLVAPCDGVPPWEAFPEVNRVLVQRLLGLLVERMTTPAAVASGRAGGERDEYAGQALAAGGGQGPAVAS